METISLKTLAKKAVERNFKGNSLKTSNKLSGNFEDNFSRLAEKLKSFSLTADEIKIQKPSLYKQIQEAIDEMDLAWLNEDLEHFTKVIKTIEELYSYALQENHDDK
jgi:hypothetical protein